MFARFRKVGRRLDVSLVNTRRSGGRVVSEHIAPLGSVALPEPIAAPERRRFWAQLEARFRHRIDEGRVSADDRRKALAAIDKRIPRPTAAEQISAAVDAARLSAERRGKRAGFRGPMRAASTPSARP